MLNEGEQDWHAPILQLLRHDGREEFIASRKQEPVKPNKERYKHNKVYPRSLVSNRDGGLTCFSNAEQQNAQQASLATSEYKDKMSKVSRVVG